MPSGSQDILVSDHDSTWTKSLTAGVLEERGLQHRPPADPKDSWDLPNRIGTRPPPQTAMWTLETGKEHMVKVTVSEQFHCLDWWWGDTLKEQVESYSFMLYIILLELHCWWRLPGAYLAGLLFGVPTNLCMQWEQHSWKGELPPWKPCKTIRKIMTHAEARRTGSYFTRTNPPTAAGSCPVMPCQCSKATGEEDARVECKFMSLVKYRPAMFCSGRNIFSKLSLREYMSQTTWCDIDSKFVHGH